MTRFLVFPVAFVIAGCVQAQEGEDTCGSAGLQGLVGQSGDIARLLVIEDRPFRVIEPGSIVTTDYRLDRLNIQIDDQDRIERVDCY